MQVSSFSCLSGLLTWLIVMLHLPSLCMEIELHMFGKRSVGVCSHAYILLGSLLQIFAKRSSIL